MGWDVKLGRRVLLSGQLVEKNFVLLIVDENLRFTIKEGSLGLEFDIVNLDSESRLIAFSTLLHVVVGSCRSSYQS